MERRSASAAPNWIWLLLPIVVAALVRDLWAPDEPRYAQITRELFDSRQFLVLRRVGVLYPDKPPLLFWLAGVLGWLSGWQVFAMRLVSIAATAGSAALTASLARRWWGEREARWAPVLYLGFVMVVEIGGRLQIDPLLAFLCLVAIHRVSAPAADAREAGRQLLIAGLAVGLGALAKGPVVYANVGLVLVAWRLGGQRVPGASSSGRARVGAAALAVLPVLSWALAAVASEPELFRDLFYGQHLERAAKGTHHAGPPWKNLLTMPTQLMPWTLPVILGLAQSWRSWRARRADGADEGLLRAGLWLAVLFVFFSILPPKRDLYLLPAYPAAALVGARWLVTSLERGRMPAALSWFTGLVFGLGGLALCAAGPIAAREDLGFLGLTWRAPLVAVPLLLGAVLLLRPSVRRDPAHFARTTTLAWLAATTVLALAVFPALDRVNSDRPLAEELAARPDLPPGIACYGLPPEGFRFYGAPTVAGVTEPTWSAGIEQQLAEQGPRFLALVNERYWKNLEPQEQARFEVLATRRIAQRQVLVLGARR